MKDAWTLPNDCRTGNHTTRCCRRCSVRSTAIMVLQLLGIAGTARCSSIAPACTRHAVHCVAEDIEWMRDEIE